jgi:uncharacterized protein (TIGR03083 family)
MAWLRVETVHLLPWIRRSLTGLLRTLGPTQWGAPTVCGDWTVGDIAAHLLGVELGNVSVRRDGAHVQGPDPEAQVTLGAWLGEFNEQWVAAARRLSPRIIADLLDLSGIWFEDHVSSLRSENMGAPVQWAGPAPAPVWMDVAREYTERWVHQQQIREVVGEEDLLEPVYLAPVVATFVHALPVALEDVPAPEGTVVGYEVEGDAGGAWHLVRKHDDWDLQAGQSREARTRLTTTADNAWRMFTRHPGARSPTVVGDPRITDAMAGAVAIIA